MQSCLFFCIPWCPAWRWGWHGDVRLAADRWVELLSEGFRTFKLTFGWWEADWMIIPGLCRQTCKYKHTWTQTPSPPKGKHSSLLLFIFLLFVCVLVYFLCQASRHNLSSSIWQLLEQKEEKKETWKVPYINSGDSFRPMCSCLLFWTSAILAPSNMVTELVIWIRQCRETVLVCVRR